MDLVKKQFREYHKTLCIIENFTHFMTESLLVFSHSYVCDDIIFSNFLRAPGLASTDFKQSSKYFKNSLLDKNLEDGQLAKMVH